MLLYDDADASTPAPAGTSGCLVYVGGDTPHPWTDADIAKQGVQYLLPTWVRSNMGGTPQTDGQEMIAWLRAHKAPAGINTVLDLETQVNPGYVIQYGAELHAAGYKVLVYGSKSTLFGNPKLDGYFVADYTGVEHVVTGTVVTQFENTPAYDLDDVESGVVLWDYQGVPVTVQILVPGVSVQEVQTDLNKHGAHLAVDGIGGPLTEAAVVAFQKADGLSPDGIVGPLTWGKLNAPLPTPAPVPVPVPKPVPVPPPPAMKSVPVTELDAIVNAYKALGVALHAAGLV